MLRVNGNKIAALDIGKSRCSKYFSSNGRERRRWCLRVKSRAAQGWSKSRARLRARAGLAAGSVCAGIVPCPTKTGRCCRAGGGDGQRLVCVGISARHGPRCKSPRIIGASPAWMRMGAGRAMGSSAGLGLHSSVPAATAPGLHITVIPGTVLPGAASSQGTHQEQLG